MDISKNLFFYATKELSHDAFFVYVLMNYDSNKEFAEEVLDGFIKAFNRNTEAIKDIKVIKQFFKIDLLIEVITDKNKYLIVFENKIKSVMHDNQLQRYVDSVSQIKLYDSYIKSFVYYKLDFLNEKKDIIPDFWIKFDLIKIIDMISNINKGQNLIVNEYIDYVTYLSDSIYKIDDDVNKWNSYSFKMFINQLCTDINVDDYTVDSYMGKWMSFRIDANEDFYFEYKHDLKWNYRDIKLVANNKGFDKSLKQNYLFEQRKKYDLVAEHPYVSKIKVNTNDKVELMELLKKAVKEYNNL